MTWRGGGDLHEGMRNSFRLWTVRRSLMPQSTLPIEPDDPKLRQTLDAAADLPVEQRPAFLDQACGGDGKLRAQVESLLNALEQADGFLATPTAPGASDSILTTDAQENETRAIGPYKLL